MPRFIILAVFCLAIFWLLASALYWPIGRLVSKIAKDAKDAMNRENTTNKETESEDEK